MGGVARELVTMPPARFRGRALGGGSEGEACLKLERFYYLRGGLLQ